MPGPTGFDVALMQHIASQLGDMAAGPLHRFRLQRHLRRPRRGHLRLRRLGLTTITPDRERLADFCPPYVVSGQSLVVDPNRHPHVNGIADLQGLVIGVQQGNTSQPVADRLVAEHRAARVRVYAYDEIETALDDLSTGGCDAFMKLAPVAEWFVRDRHRLKVVAAWLITRERLGVCVRKGNTVLRAAIGNAEAVLIQNGRLPALLDSGSGRGRRQAREDGERGGQFRGIIG